MTVEFYLAQPVDDLNERRALYRVARLLYGRYGHDERQHFILVANVPELVEGLTQLDGLLFGPRFVALLEFKDYADPIDGMEPDRSWYVRGTPQKVEGGKSRNPYKQARYAHYQWGHYLAKQAKQLLTPARYRELKTAWPHLNDWVLFYPYLHPDSRIMHPGGDKKWLSFRSIDEVVALAGESYSGLCLAPEEARRFTEELLKARPWPELHRSLDDVIGYLHVPDADSTRTAYRVRSFESLTIGRSRHHHIRVDRVYGRVSGSHARLEARQQAVRLFDVGSKYGTFVAGQRVDSEGGVLLQQGDVICLGSPDDERACQIRFETRPPPGQISWPTKTGLTD